MLVAQMMRSIWASRIGLEFEAGKKAKMQLEKEFNAKKKEVQTEETAIRKMGEELREAKPDALIVVGAEHFGNFRNPAALNYFRDYALKISVVSCGFVV